MFDDNHAADVVFTSADKARLDFLYAQMEAAARQYGRAKPSEEDLTRAEREEYWRLESQYHESRFLGIPTSL